MKLAGFKSFVDPTTVNFPSSMCGVVGPNGCGKSNIIDAVRWVMGESSAKQLRGDSLTDVIFNGSGGRKPVGQASIELLFDNSDGRIGGEYASYAEISVRRRVTREGASDYFLNGTRCRRKDIMDIFLGTGMGPRSYAIIEQGMISNLITAKPEDLRVYVEEAAGISKYKERRRDTENRIRRTRENLERLDDIREELSRQLQRLQRQAKAAESYKELRTQERQLKSELLALQWQSLDERVAEKKAGIRDLEIALESLVAEDTKSETTIEKLRNEQVELTDSFNAVQSNYYSLGAEIARIEQAIQHQEEAARKLLEDMSRTDANVGELETHLRQDASRVKGWEAELGQFAEQREKLERSAAQFQDQLDEAENLLNDWNQRWETFSEQASEPKQQSEVQQSRIQYLESSMEETRQRIERLKSEHVDEEAFRKSASELQQKSDECQKIAAKVEQKQSELAQIEERLPHLRTQNSELSGSIDETRRQIQQQSGALSSQQALHEAAMGQDDKELDAWLSAAKIESANHLVDNIQVEKGWEQAVEVVLGDLVRARLVDDLGQLKEALPHFPGGVLAIMDSASSESPSAMEKSLAECVDHPGAKKILARVGRVDSFEEAMSKRATLGPQDSLVTADGIWVGSGWLRLHRNLSEESVLQRRQSIEKLEQSLSDLQQKETQLVQRQQEGRAELEQLEQQIRVSRAALEASTSELSRAENGRTALEVRIQQMELSRETQQREITSAEERYREDQNNLAKARSDLEKAVELMALHNGQREKLQQERESIGDRLKNERTQTQGVREQINAIQLRENSVKTQLASVRESMERMERQLDRLREHRASLETHDKTEETPVDDLKSSLAKKLEERLESEHKLQSARTLVENSQQAMRDQEVARQKIQQRLNAQREEIQSRRIEAQEVITRAQTLLEQLNGADPKDILDKLDEAANENDWRQNLDQIARRIERLGPINLAAIDEFQSESERKSYLDAQNEELTSALQTLENAIRKIDRETRTRFKETFEKMNAGFKTLFPQLFGGGHAYLELTSEDLLDAGVTIMARPPGKRNSTIHLLSGGEKAMTAIALVFAIFKLNPAPFCMLDEVDAPLDDANVARFAELVRQMSESVQFIFITHNKISMEMAHQLMGVTMQEPGVSRLVTVDVDKAVELATA
jgi:chromosome segregation protein